MELARKTGRESLKFIKGEIGIDCPECPVKHSLCDVITDIYDTFGQDAVDLICYGALMKFLFSEDYYEVSA